jgi:hypothetical protein
LGGIQKQKRRRRIRRRRRRRRRRTAVAGVVGHGWVVASAGGLAFLFRRIVFV